MKSKWIILAITLLCSSLVYSQSVGSDVDKAAKDTGHATKTAGRKRPPRARKKLPTRRAT